jgi:DUF4097 and DUF4098 domain-containing protein YvlB
MRWTLIVFSTAIFLLFSSCVIAVVDFRDNVEGFPSEGFYKIVPLEPGGTLSLENIDGDIAIYGWERNEVEVTAEKLVPRSYGRRVRVFSLKHMMPQIELDRFEGFVKIRTKAASGIRGGGIVNYEVMVPQSIDLKNIIGKEGNIVISDLYGKVFAELERGDVTVKNFSGSLTVSAMVGSVESELYDLRSEDEVKITTNEGDITIFLQPEVTAHIDAQAPNGSILSEFDLKESLPAREVSVEIGGEGGAFLSLSTLKGDIHLKKIE